MDRYVKTKILQALITVFDGLSKMLTDKQTDIKTNGHTDGRTERLIQMRGRI